MVLADEDGRHHVWLRATSPTQPLAFVVVRDAAIEIRRQAAWRLDRRLAGTRAPASSGAFGPTPFQRLRLNRLLDILDILQSPDRRATSYDIARLLLYPDMKIGRGADWKSSAERRRTMRLIDRARRLVNGGYRELLRGIVRGRQKRRGQPRHSSTPELLRHPPPIGSAPAWSGRRLGRRTLMDASMPVVARYLKTPDAATHLGLSPRTLEKHRCYGTGPVYRRLGGRIVYAIADLDAWAALGLRRSTSDPGVGIVYPAKRRPAEA